MPQKAWSPKRERQYEHIKDSYEDRGVSEGEAEERAARTVNKERAEHGETKQQRSKEGQPAGTRSGARSPPPPTWPSMLASPSSSASSSRSSPTTSIRGS